MYWIDMDKQINCKLGLFPDNQPWVEVEGPKSSYYPDVGVRCSLTDSVKLVQLLMVKEALDNLKVIATTLFIPYLMAARSDRRMRPGGAHELRVVGDLISTLDFGQVVLFDPHSDVAEGVIKHAKIIRPNLLMGHVPDGSALIVPDAGAAKKAQIVRKENLEKFPYIFYAHKTRDVVTGAVKVSFEGNNLAGYHCVIVDDLCDGGATFLQLGQILRERKASSLTLVVSHGVFSNMALPKLLAVFDRIITSNSYPGRGYVSSSRVTVVPLENYLAEAF